MAESSRWQEVQTMFGRVTFKIIFKDWPINHRLLCLPIPLPFALWLK